MTRFLFYITVLFGVAACSDDQPVLQELVSFEQWQAREKAIKLSGQHSEKILTVSSKKIALSVVPVDQYTFAVVTSKAPRFDKFPLAFIDIVRPVEKATGCSVPRGIITFKPDLGTNTRVNDGPPAFKTQAYLLNC